MRIIYRLLAIFLLFIVPVIAGANETQEQNIKRKDVPKPILESFAKSYPKAKIKGYSKEIDEGKWVYEIESTEGKVHRDVSYNPDGTVISIEESLPLSEVPSAVKSSLDKDFAKYKVVKIEKVTTGNKIKYEFVLKSGKKLLEVVFDAEGKLVKKEAKSKKDKD